ncbi:MAG: DUF2935 domain-containing protein [Candidatus Limnocylindria bacterium]
MADTRRDPTDETETEPRVPVDSMDVLTRTPNAAGAESKFEKVVVLPNADDKDPSNHAWADARFATDILSEHGLFFALLMPEELAKEERAEALGFYREFGEMHRQVAASKPPERSGIKPFLGRIRERVMPFIEYKQRLGDAQKSGKLRSLVWPLFFDHTRHEAERWNRRFDALSRGEIEFERREVVTFWTNIMDEHARFVAHLLDPDEYALIEKAFKTAEVFRRLQSDGLAGAVTALAAQPGTVAGSLGQNPDLDAVMSAAQTMLDFKTQAVRDIESARIKSIIEPRLADHVRREALKFVNELKRAV